MKDYKIIKNDIEPKMKVGTYFLAFNKDENNHYFVNFKTLNELSDYIASKGILNLYNEWLDYICSDFIADKIEEYYIGKVIKENSEYYIVNFTDISGQ